MLSSGPSRPIKGRKGSRHDRTGCLTCRTRRKKCIENTFPICGHCIRLNLECVREPPRRIVPVKIPLFSSTSRSRSSSSSPDVVDTAVPVTPTQSTALSSPRLPDPNLGVHLSFTRTELTTPTSRTLMKYYVNHLSSLVAATHENNAFLTVFLPMATESAPVLEALIAWSSGHLSVFDESYKVPALEARCRALSTMAKTLTLPSPVDSTSGASVVGSTLTAMAALEANLATALVMATNEIGLGTEPGWASHLLGAKHIVLSAHSSAPGGRILHGPDVFMTSSDGQWLLRNFAYHDVIWSVTSNSPPLLTSNYLADISVETDSYLGAAFPILRSILETSCLEDPNPHPLEDLNVVVYDDLEELGENMRTFWSAAGRIEHELKNWTCASSASPCMAALAHTYRSAALLHLYRRIRSFGYPTPPHWPFALNDRIMEEVETTMSNVLLIPLTEAPICGLLFPLFMAGGETLLPKHIETIRSRLSFMLEERGFQNVKNAAEVLERLWALKWDVAGTGREESIDWLQLVEKGGKGLILT